MLLKTITEPFRRADKEQHHTIANYNARLTNTYGSPLKVT